ncbi:hypothetical protein GCM10009738_12310 [Kitasatospora viridis]
MLVAPVYGQVTLVVLPPTGLGGVVALGPAGALVGAVGVAAADVGAADVGAALDGGAVDGLADAPAVGVAPAEVLGLGEVLWLGEADGLAEAVGLGAWPPCLPQVRWSCVPAAAYAVGIEASSPAVASTTSRGRVIMDMWDVLACACEVSCRIRAVR